MAAGTAVLAPFASESRRPWARLRGYRATPQPWGTLEPPSLSWEEAETAQDTGTSRSSVTATESHSTFDLVHRQAGPLTSDAERGIVPAVVPEISWRFRCPTLMIAALLCGFAAFGTILILQIVEFNSKKGNVLFGLDHRYESGFGYWPPTVSESVHDSESPQGKIFYTFLLMFFLGAFLSWYPYNLRNVYTGPEMVPCLCIYWTTVRQYIPSMGCLLLIGVTTYPPPVASASPGKLYEACVTWSASSSAWRCLASGTPSLSRSATWT